MQKGILVLKIENRVCVSSWMEVDKTFDSMKKEKQEQLLRQTRIVRRY